MVTQSVILNVEEIDGSLQDLDLIRYFGGTAHDKLLEVQAYLLNAQEDNNRLISKDEQKDIESLISDSIFLQNNLSDSLNNISDYEDAVCMNGRAAFNRFISISRSGFNDAFGEDKRYLKNALQRSINALSPSKNLKLGIALKKIIKDIHEYT